MALVCLVLSACGGDVAVAPPRAEAPGHAIRPGPDGLRLEGTELRVDFGRTRSSTIAAVTKLRGTSPRITRNDECGAGPMSFAEYPAGLTLNFLDGDFVGWTNRSPAIRATNALAPGATRAQVAATGAKISQTTLGDEFELGGVRGLIEQPGAQGKVALMWAGTTCFFR